MAAQHSVATCAGKGCVAWLNHRPGAAEADPARVDDLVVCPGKKPPKKVVKHLVCPYKSATERKFTVGNAKGG